MCPLIETIKCHDGELFNLSFHQARFDRARQFHYPGSQKINLSGSIKIPTECANGLFRCRVIYARTIEKIEFIPHIYRQISSLKLITANDISYEFKYANREMLQQLFEQRGSCDDILIVKNGFVTDSFTANTIFFDGMQWWTPDTPLLPGIQRDRLLSEKKIKICPIPVNDLWNYQKIGLINAMQDMTDMPVIEISHPEYRDSK
jgi:4-amino-4-deoxychorismate lyase